MAVIVILFVLPILASCSSDGNIHLMEEDVLNALRACSNNNKAYTKDGNGKRTVRSHGVYNHSSPRIDFDAGEMNQYNHERRNTTFNKTNNVLNGTINSDYSDYESQESSKNHVNEVQRPFLGNNNNYLTNNVNTSRTKRNEPLIGKEDNEQCLSQCVFANLQVVDSRGIPLEAELWNKVQTSVTSQQSRILLKDQIRACFQELQTESEENGCSYSNKLERCLMLRFFDRKLNTTESNSTKKD